MMITATQIRRFAPLMAVAETPPKPNSAARMASDDEDERVVDQITGHGGVS